MTFDGLMRAGTMNRSVAADVSGAHGQVRVEGSWSKGLGWGEVHFAVGAPADLDAAVHDEPDASGGAALAAGPVGLGRERSDGDVQAGGLAGRGRKVNGGGRPRHRA